MIVSRAAASFGLLVLVLSGCSPNVEERLRSCPADDLLWEHAIDEAKKDKGLEELSRLCEEIAATCPDRWEPLWAAGETLYKHNSKADVETFEQMRRFWEGALERAHLSGSPIGISRAANRLGTYYKRVSNLDQAERLIGTALEAAEAADRDDLRAFAHNNLAGAYRTRVRLAEAIEALEKATFYLKRAGRTKDARTFAYNRALLLQDVGLLSEQRKVLERIYDESVEAGDIYRVHRVCVATGNHYLLHDDLDTARDWYFKVPEDSEQATNAALGLGRAALRARDYDEAVRHLDTVCAGDAHETLTMFGKAFRAEADLRMGRIDSALDRLRSLTEDADSGGVRDIAAMARSLHGKSLMTDPARLDEAIEQFRGSLNIVEGAAEGLKPSAGGMTFMRERAEPFADLASALALRDAEGSAAEIFGIVERAHARALRQILGGEGRATETVQLEAMAAALAPGEVLLDYLIGNDRGVLIAISPRTVRVATMPGWRELREPLSRYISALKRPLLSLEARENPDADLARDIDRGRALRRELLGPVADLLTGVSRIYLVPDRDLALLPFSALPLDDPADASGRFAYLGDNVEIAVMPMAGPARGGSAQWTPVLMAGDPLPDPDGEFPALPLASEEISELIEVWRGEQVTRLVREELVPESLDRLNLADFNLLHFATHAVASSRDPEQCAVILSGGQRLGMRRITGLKLGPALVVLSACQTGKGEVIPGEGVVGLTWAFLHAGATSVVASLWSVEDSATTELMVSFHRNLRSGEDPVRALSMAQRELSQVRRHPVFWAPFAVVLSP